MPQKLRKCWYDSVGPYGSTVRVGEREPGGVLYLFWIDSTGARQKRSLGHRDRKLGKRQALELSHRIATNTTAAHTERVTLKLLVTRFLAEGMHGRSASHRRETARKLERLANYFGWNRAVDSLARDEFSAYVEARRGGLSGVVESNRPVGPTTVKHDLVALKTACNWAMQDFPHLGGRPLISKNPLAGFRMPKEISPRRPVAGDAHYRALRAVATELPASFAVALDLAFTTGHRIGAILRLRWEDVDFRQSQNAPYGAIRWRAANDKIGNDHTVPMDSLAFSSLSEWYAIRQSDEWVLPSPTDATRPLDRRLVSRWLRKAEKVAGFPRQRGNGWHAFRRGWATARKGYSLKDVAAAGGWKETESLLACYQQSDPETILQVVTTPLKSLNQ